jgi:hypothetical protein
MSRGRKFRVEALSFVAACLLSTIAEAQARLDTRLIGTWIRANTGDRLVIKPDAEVELLFGGTAAPFSGLGAIAPCTAADRGANLCIGVPRATCSFLYEFSGFETLTLQFRTSPDSVSACEAAAGEFRLRAPNNITHAES